jgi:hypothetical protein
MTRQGVGGDDMKRVPPCTKEAAAVKRFDGGSARNGLEVAGGKGVGLTCSQQLGSPSSFFPCCRGNLAPWSLSPFPCFHCP